MGAPQGITLSEQLHAFTFLISEDSDGSGYLSRDAVTIGANQTLPVGQVLGAQVQTTMTAEVVTAGTNTGTGVLTLASPAVTSDVLPGNYRLVFTDATHFEVQEPSGSLLGEGVVGTAWTKHVLFTLAAGTPAFVAGDTFKINVDETSAGTEVYVAWDPSKTDGSERAKAILGYRTITTNGFAAQAVVVNAHATVRLSDLTFNASATSAQIDQAKRDLGKSLIKFR